MKKLILMLPVLATMITFNKEVKQIFAPEKPISKQVSFTIYRGGDYTSAAYNEAKAKVHVTIFKMRGNKQTIVWQKNFSNMQLKNYPTMQHALQQEVYIPNVFDSKEKLIVRYNITYDAKGSILETQNDEPLNNGLTKGSLHISI